MIYAIIILVVVVIAFAIIIGIFNKRNGNTADPKETAIINALPGVDCGACGYESCAACGVAIFSGEAPFDACPVGGMPTAKAVATILGQAALVLEPIIARVACNGTKDNVKTLYEYTGAPSCVVAKTSFGGQKMCNYSCFGFGNCGTACPYDAITMVDGIPVVNRKKCTSCGACVKACPQDLFHLVPRKQHVFVSCSNLDQEADAVSQSCKVGCIKCKKCEAACPYDAIHVTDIARITYKKCTNCEACVAVCPTKTIQVDTFIDDHSRAPKPQEVTGPKGCGSGSGCGGCSAKDNCASNI